MRADISKFCSEVRTNAPKCNIPRNKIGYSPFPRSYPLWGGCTPHNTPRPRCLRHLDLPAPPPPRLCLQNFRYATADYLHICIACLRIIRLIGKALTFTHELSFFSFISVHRARQPRSRWPSNLFRRFDGR